MTLHRASTGVATSGELILNGACLPSDGQQAAEREYLRYKRLYESNRTSNPMNRVTLRQLEYFVNICETGSMTAASQRIHISQSAISTALSDLEITLGVQLFVRRARGLTITQSGRQLLTKARQLLANADELKSYASDLSGSLSGRLAVGCYSTLSLALLPLILDQYLTLHPHVDLDFTVGSHAELQEQIRDGRCEAALLYDYDFATDLFPADMERIVLKSMPPYALLAADHPLAQHAKISLTDLVSEPLILFDLAPSGEYFKSMFETRDMTPEIRFRTSEFELVRSLVARGLGYSILTQHTTIDTSYEDKPLVKRPIKEAPRNLSVVIAYLADAQLTRRATAFIEQCQRTLTEPEPGSTPD